MRIRRRFCRGRGVEGLVPDQVPETAVSVTTREAPVESAPDGLPYPDATQSLRSAMTANSDTRGVPHEIEEGKKHRSFIRSGVRIGLTDRLFLLVIAAISPALIIQAWNEYDLRLVTRPMSGNKSSKLPSSWVRKSARSVRCSAIAIGTHSIGDRQIPPVRGLSRAVNEVEISIPELQRAWGSRFRWPGLLCECPYLIFFSCKISRSLRVLWLKTVLPSETTGSISPVARK
jgi:hypothetical protein